MQVAKGGVVDALEDRAGDPVDAADHDRPLGVARLGAGDEGVSERRRCARRLAPGEVGADAVAGRADDGLVRARQRPRRRAGQRNSRMVGVEVGDAVDRRLDPVAALEQDRQVEGAEVGDHADAVAEEGGAVAEPDGGVVVARRHDDRGDLRQAR